MSLRQINMLLMFTMCSYSRLLHWSIF